jgi:hypothetical protein
MTILIMKHGYLLVLASCLIVAIDAAVLLLLDLSIHEASTSTY